MEIVSSSASSPPPHHHSPLLASSRSADYISSGTDGGGGGGGVGDSGVGYIEHPVSKMDTLAGVAIKYGVEVADIKRMNGLVADLQMFALKSLYIPLPGRHPPSPILSNGYEAQRTCNLDHTPPPRRHSGSFESFKSLKLNSTCPQGKVSPAMSKLQGYYGIKSKNQKDASEGFEMAVYSKESSHYLEDGPFPKPSPSNPPPLDYSRKYKSIANGFLLENGELAANGSSSPAKSSYSSFGKWTGMLVRRCEKSETDFTSRAKEMLLREDNGSGGGFSTGKGNGLAMRLKTGSRIGSGSDTEASLSDSIAFDGSSEVRKSSSTPSLQDQESNAFAYSPSSSMWPTSKWSMKPDLPAAITKPILEGFPGWRNKTALD